MAENIFAEIYNKILGLFGQAEQKEESKNTAVSRLRLVLMQDRTNLTPEIMHRMRTELIEVLSTYVELDKEALDLNFEQEGEQMALMLSIPVVRAKDEAEIEASIKEREEAKKSAESETNEDVEEENNNSEENSENDENEESDSEEETQDNSQEFEEAKEESDDEPCAEENEGEDAESSEESQAPEEKRKNKKSSKENE